MPHPKFVLQLPMSDPGLLPGFVESCLARSGSLIAVVGEGCVELEDEIDWLIVGDGSDDSRFIVTSSHPEESLEEVMRFAAGWGDADGPTDLVRL